MTFWLASVSAKSYMLALTICSRKHDLGRQAPTSASTEPALREGEEHPSTHPYTHLLCCFELGLGSLDPLVTVLGEVSDFTLKALQATARKHGFDCSIEAHQ
jgi:hypothetical protein